MAGTGINAHFLFNVLTVIMVLTRRDPEQALKVEEDLAVYLRGAMEASGDEDRYISLSEELETVNAYLRIQNVRFKDRFVCDIRVENTDALVPVGAVRNAVELVVGRNAENGTEVTRLYIEQEMGDAKSLVCVRDDEMSVSIEGRLLKYRSVC